MMKKRILHYLPVMIAAALFLLCLLSLGIYDKTSVPLATVSFSAEIPTDPTDELLGKRTVLAVDLSVSAGGKVLSVDFPDERSLEFFEPLSLIGRSLEGAFGIIAEDVPTMPNGTAFVGAFASEEKKEAEGLYDDLKGLLELAKKGYSKSALFVHGIYTDEAVRRAQTHSVTLGRMAYALYFSEESDKADRYVDVYAILESDPYDIAYYIRNIANDTLCADLSRVKEYDRYMSQEEARTIAVSSTTIWYGYVVDNLTYTGIAYYMGALSYRFIPPEDETPYVFFVNMTTGEVLVGDL